MWKVKALMEVCVHRHAPKYIIRSIEDEDWGWLHILYRTVSNKFLVESLLRCGCKFNKIYITLFYASMQVHNRTIIKVAYKHYNGSIVRSSLHCINSQASLPGFSETCILRTKNVFKITFTLEWSKWFNYKLKIW